MNLIINPQGGMAGDMFAAALISAGADEENMLEAMIMAANKIGRSSISTNKTHDNAIRLTMTMNHNHGHLAASKARKILTELLEDLNINDSYATFAHNVLENLINAEKQAHAENTFLTDHQHSHDEKHEHHHHHKHHHEEAWLHEAQDIIIDIIGAAKGLQLLNAPIQAKLSAPVSLGGGKIKFSHGEMMAPAPATKILIDKKNIPVELGPIDVELCTPTGAAILAALEANTLSKDFDISNASKKGFSRGSKDLDIPPLCVFLI